MLQNNVRVQILVAQPDPSIPFEIKRCSESSTRSAWNIDFQVWSKAKQAEEGTLLGNYQIYSLPPFIQGMTKDRLAGIALIKFAELHKESGKTPDSFGIYIPAPNDFSYFSSVVKV